MNYMIHKYNDLAIVFTKLHFPMKYIRYDFRHGLIPNGGRVYYLNRSQPPLLTPMVQQYYEATNDTGFVRDNIGILEQEYQWWMQNRLVEVHLLFL